MVLTTRPVTDWDTATGLEPDPGIEKHDAVDPYAFVVPYSNSHLLTFVPLGLTVALRVAVVWVIEDAGFVLRQLIYPARCHTGALGWATNQLQFVSLWERQPT